MSPQTGDATFFFASTSALEISPHCSSSVVAMSDSPWPPYTCIIYFINKLFYLLPFIKDERPRCVTIRGIVDTQMSFKSFSHGSSSALSRF
jgi:hypothetical protein